MEEGAGRVWEPKRGEDHRITMLCKPTEKVSYEHTKTKTVSPEPA